MRLSVGEAGRSDINDQKTLMYVNSSTSRDGIPSPNCKSRFPEQEKSGKIPILGVCLGHQSIGQAFGGRIVHARQVMHGKTSPIHHADVGVFSGLENPFEATRYHSLVIEQASLPDCLEVTAWTQRSDGGVDEIMGVRHKTLDVQGVQFHPESILTQHGHDMLKNFITGK